jgi:hypothetical protein
VHEPCEYFFARAGFAGDEDRDIRGGDAARRVENGLHLLGNEQNTRLRFDRIRGPECGAAAFFLASRIELQQRSADVKDVGDGQGVGGRGRHVAR